ncbi:MAG: elongation factor G [Myxococcales bacterium]
MATSSERKIPKWLGRIRNIGIMAHIDAGKTTVTERLLFCAGRSHKMGEVHDGQATMDWMPQEQERGITITSAVTSFEWADHELHLIDTPGHVDFTIEVERSLRVLDGAIAVFDGVAGVEPQSETVWRQADHYHVPRVAFVNKMDRIGADFAAAVESMRSHFAQTIVPIQLPIGFEGGFRGVVDLVERRAMVWASDDPRDTLTLDALPPDVQGDVERARTELVECLADVSDEIATRYLEGEELDAATLRDALREGCLSTKLVPVLCGSALRNKGIPPLLDAACAYLPSPADVAEITGTHPTTGANETRSHDEKGPLCALVFKVSMMDDGRRMAFVRIYSGSLAESDDVFNVGRGFKEKVSRIFLMHARSRTRTERAKCGYLVGVLGLKRSMTGDTLTGPTAPLLLERIEAYEPVISRSIEPLTLREKEKLDEALARFVDEDPTFRVSDDPQTGQTLIRGMGELHLEIIVDRLRREFDVEARVGSPEVVYQETATVAAEAEDTFYRKTDEEELFGHVRIRVEPHRRGAGNDFIDLAPAGWLSDGYRQAIREGTFEAMKAGVIEGYDVQDVRVCLLDAENRPGASKPLAYKIAASTAVRKALREARCELLQPIMKAEIVVPDEYVGEVIGSINARRGRIDNLHDRPKAKVLEASVALRRMFGYSTELRSITQGRASFTMQFARYDVE